MVHKAGAGSFTPQKIAIWYGAIHLTCKFGQGVQSKMVNMRLFYGGSYGDKVKPTRSILSPEVEGPPSGPSTRQDAHPPHPGVRPKGDVLIPNRESP